MNPTDIEWVRSPAGGSGYTSNPLTGCHNHVGGLCNGGGFPCYAHRLANTRLKDRYLANLNIAIQNETIGNPFDDPFYPRFWSERLEELRGLTRRKPRGVFVADMGDLFGIGVPEKWTNDVLDAIEVNKKDRFYLLTKQPQNLIKYSPFPPNCYVGVTVTNKSMLSKATDGLMNVQAKVKFISFEPLLGSCSFYPEQLQYVGISWVIIGGQTRPTRMPEISAVQEIVEAADRAGVAVFLKDNLQSNQDIEGYYPFYCDSTGFPLHHLRQEMPSESKHSGSE